MRKPADLIDREHEWAELSRLWASERPEVVLVLGRRRVGKSHLLAPFAQAAEGIYYQATRRSDDEQLRTLTRLVGRHFDDPALVRGSPFADWDALLDYLADRAGPEPFLLVLDEYPYLEQSSPGISSVLQRWIDHRLPGTRIKLVLSGSYISAMKQLEAADQPLHARRTGRLNIVAFDPARAALFVPEWTPRDQLRAYATFGGLPGHLVHLDGARSLAENVRAHILNPAARLFDEGQRVLDGFHGEATVHYSILAAIARGERTWKGICSRTGKRSGSLSRPMRWLMEMDLVERVVPVTESKPARSKRALYRVADPYLVFWHRFVSPLIEAGLPATVGAEVLWEKRVAPGLDDHLGPVFEAAVRDFVGRTDDLPFQPLRVGGWWNHDNTEELDVVALGFDGEIFAAECKWGGVDRDDLSRLRARAEMLVAELGGASEVHLALFSGRPVTDEAVLRAEADDEVCVYGPEALVG